MNIASPLGQRPHEFRWVFKLHPMRLSTQDFWRPHMWIHFRGPSGTKWLDHAIRSRDFGSVRSCWSFCSKEMSYSRSFVSIFHFSEDLIFSYQLAAHNTGHICTVLIRENKLCMIKQPFQKIHTWFTTIPRGFVFSTIFWKLLWWRLQCGAPQFCLLVDKQTAITAMTMFFW